ncbi:MAG: FAD-dependent oxidoreductase [Gemmataceae bacterium]
MRERFDVIILGAGFAGSLLSLMLHQRGFRVALLERGRHPRFSLGESSTPLANLALEEISQEYQLPWLANLAEYGRWKKHYPDLPCGLKRGFTFVRHVPGRPHEALPDHANELLVAASPNDEVSDTQWLRADFDAFLAGQAVQAGVRYLDQLHLDQLTNDPASGWHLVAGRDGERIEIECTFLVDATGPTGALARELRIDSSPTQMRTHSWAIFNHFEGVERWETLARHHGVRTDEHPYRCDDAALHHVMDGAWMWLLRFDHDLTSAGILVDGQQHPCDARLDPEQEWNAWLARYPDIQAQFARARPIRRWERTGRIQRCAAQTAGSNWAMLGPAAYSLDALYSTGNAHALATVQRLARCLEQHWHGDLPRALVDYDATLRREIAFLDEIVSTTYQTFRQFGLLCVYAMVYFAGAITSEERRKAGLATPRDEFLHSHDPEFRAAVLRLSQRARSLATESNPDVESFRQEVAQGITQWNSVGLCDPGKRNLYPYA